MSNSVQTYLYQTLATADRCDPSVRLQTLARFPASTGDERKYVALESARIIFDSFVPKNTSILCDMIPHLKTAVAITPDDPVLHQALACIHAYFGEFTHAKAYARAAEKASPNDPHILCAHGNICTDLGSIHDNQAALLLEKAHNQAPKDTIILESLSRHFLYRQQQRKATHFYALSLGKANTAGITPPAPVKRGSSYQGHYLALISL